MQAVNIHLTNERQCKLGPIFSCFPQHFWLRPNYSPHRFLFLFSHNSKRLSLEISIHFWSKLIFIQFGRTCGHGRSFWHLSIDYYWHDKGWWDAVNTKGIYLHVTHIVSLNNNLKSLQYAVMDYTPEQVLKIRFSYTEMNGSQWLHGTERNNDDHVSCNNSVSCKWVVVQKQKLANTLLCSCNTTIFLHSDSLYSCHKDTVMYTRHIIKHY